MALLMVHLLVADRWAQGRPAYAECPEFFLGAISPDAIHIRDHDDKSHKDEIHLNNWQRPNPDRVIGYWRERSAPFDVGYGVHVLTDGQWVPRYKERLRGMFRPDGTLDTSIYYNDTYVTDFELLHALPRLEALLGLIERAEVPADHPLLTRYELAAWREAMLSAYRAPCPRSGPARFIDQAYARDFIEDCQPLIEATFAAALG